MTKRIVSLILAVIMLVGMMVVPSSAAPTLEEAMEEVNVYAKNDDLVWLTMNGAVKDQHYTYYNYTSVQSGQNKEIPAYCVDPRLYGVPKLVDEGTAIKYSAESTVNDPKVCGIIANGYPHMDLATLGLQSVDEAYYATKTALWIYLLDNWTLDGMGINPNLTGADKQAAQRVLKATRDIYNRGMSWDKMVTPKLTAKADRDTAYPVTINGEDYYQQIITITTETWAIETVKLSLAAGAPSGAKILDMNNQEIDRLTITTSGPNGYEGQCKIVYPADGVSETGTAQLNMNSVVVQYAIYYARCLETDEYGNVQDYMLDTDPHIPIAGSFISRFSPSDTPDDPDEPETGLKITKLEKGTNIPLEGAVMEVTGPDGDTLGTFSTGADGTVTIPLNRTGHFTVEEITPPQWHLLDENNVRHVTVEHGKIAEVTFTNAPYGNLRVTKMSDTGEGLKGATIQVKHIESGATYTQQTMTGGYAFFDQLKPGAYEVRELAGVAGWQADTDTIQTITVVSGDTVDATMTNRELPGLRIVKYDRQDHLLMPNVTFEIFKDAVSLGKFRTDQQGEILLLDAEPGTYLAYEVDTGSTEHILDTTPQQVELKAGDGIKQLVFFNDRLPGIHLVKVDSSDLSKPIANAKFRFESVAGDYGPVELTTLEDGTIDLSQLPVGAYVVTELECPGFVIDDGQRIVQLDGNEQAQFVFTNSKKPSLHLYKQSSDGSPLAGVSYRLAKIEDGSYYLDRTTSTTGEIVWEGLEPGIYSLKEISTLSDHILDTKEYHIELFPGKISTKVLQNHKRPNLTIYKFDADDHSVPVPGTTFLVSAADGHSVAEVAVGEDGSAVVPNLLPGVYRISETSVGSSAYLMDAPDQYVTLYPDRNRTAYFYNHKRPVIEIIKRNEITQDPLENVAFQVWYASNNTETGEYNDLGVYYTDEEGRIELTGPVDGLRDGWFRVKELEPPTGFSIKSDTQEAFVQAGKGHTFRFFNTPLSAICVWKYDSIQPNTAIEGAVFQVRYLSGNTSGTGGTVIGTYRTSANGSFTVTGCKAGTFIIEELSSDGAHVIDTPPQTVYLSGLEQEVVQVYFGNSPKGALLVNKVTDDDKKLPLSGVEFMVTDSTGAVVGDSNGRFVTDSTGSFLVENVDPGTSLVVKEVRAKPGYLLDETPQTATIQAGQTVTLEFRNKPLGNLIIHKLSSADKKTPLAGVQFKITYADGSYLPDEGGKLSSNGLYWTDENGQIILSGIVGTVVATEVQSIPGYTIDPSIPKSLEWWSSPSARL